MCFVLVSYLLSVSFMAPKVLVIKTHAQLRETLSLTEVLVSKGNKNRLFKATGGDIAIQKSAVSLNNLFKHSNKCSAKLCCFDSSSLTTDVLPLIDILY